MRVAGIVACLAVPAGDGADRDGHEHDHEHDGILAGCCVGCMRLHVQPHSCRTIHAVSCSPTPPCQPRCVSVALAAGVHMRDGTLVVCWLPMKGERTDTKVRRAPPPGRFQYVQDHRPVPWRKSARFSPTACSNVASLSRFGHQTTEGQPRGKAGQKGGGLTACWQPLGRAEKEPPPGSFMYAGPLPLETRQGQS